MKATYLTFNHAILSIQILLKRDLSIVVGIIYWETIIHIVMNPPTWSMTH